MSTRTESKPGETEGAPESGPPGLPPGLRGGGARYRAYPGLARARWLFPANRPDVRRAGINGLFRPSSPKGRVLQALIRSVGLPGRNVSLRRDAVVRLETELAGALGEPEVCVAFYLGVPGAYRKITAQVMTPGGVTLAFAKVSTSPATRQLIERERRVLHRLAESQGLRGRVPEVLHTFDWEESRVLLITGGPDRTGPGRLTEAHLQLHRDVFLPFARRGTFAESGMMSRVSGTLHRIGPRLPEHLSARLNHALGRLRKELGPVRMPLSLCHRDFAPWNTRVGPGGLFVFDWDGAQKDTIPLYDLFHFQAIQAALFGRNEALPDLPLVRRVLDGLWPEGRGHLSLLYLAYLLDMGLYYGEARVNAPEVGEDRVWNWFCGQVGAFLEHGSAP